MTKVLSHPGIDNDSLAQEKIYWVSSVAVTLMILILAIVYHLVFPNLRIIIYYALILAAIYSQGIIVPLIRRNFGVWYQFVNSALVTVITLICIIKLGGIPNSGGLIFVGLATVFFTLNVKHKWHSIWLFIIYIVSVIIAGVVHPYLTVPPEMTPAVNISLFVINLVWISVFALFFVLNFISQQVKLEQIESQRLKDLNEIRNKLITNITHEFRTPLTIILGMSDLIKEQPEKWLDEGVTKIENNSRILLRLVNQMLDLARLEAGVLPVTLIQGDVVLYIRYITELFNSVAENKNITLSFKADPDKFLMDYDPDKLTEIISNLISNAIKYTQPGGHVEINTYVANKPEERFIINVRDDGPGIAEDKLPFVFERFFRIESTGSPAGSGLGLAFTRELVKLFSGTIRVESVYGKGSDFIISLPVTNNAPPSDDVKTVDIKILPGIVPVQINNLPVPGPAKLAGRNKPQILVVEDSIDVIHYLNAMLEREYEVLIALNGREGLNKAVESIPDIILTDIMMPEMDGIELLDRTKNDIRTSHIPVVMLTARTDVASRIESLNKGADAYIAKPFNKEELLLQLKKLIELRKRLQERYFSMSSVKVTGDREYELEDSFMEKIQTIISQNLSIEGFNINELCKALTMSRTQLYRKFKSLTNKTVSDYLRSFRLHRARELLLSSKFNVSESAYKTGFRNLSHFSKVFTEEFGVNPRDVNKNN